MVEAHLTLVPGDDDVILGVDHEAFDPDAHLFQGILVVELDVDVAPILVNLGCEKRGVFAHVVKIEGEDSINSSCDESVVLVAEVGEIYQSDRRHVDLGDYFHEFV